MRCKQIGNDDIVLIVVMMMGCGDGHRNGDRNRNDSYRQSDNNQSLYGTAVVIFLDCGSNGMYARWSERHFYLALMLSGRLYLNATGERISWMSLAAIL